MKFCKTENSYKALVPNSIKNVSDGAYYILDYLAETKFTNKKYKNEYEYWIDGNVDIQLQGYSDKSSVEKYALKSSYIPISSVIVQNIFTSYSSSVIMNELLEPNYIERDYYQPGVKCYGYRINPELHNTRFEYRNISDPHFIKKYNLYKEKKVSELPQYLYDYLNTNMYKFQFRDYSEIIDINNNITEADIDEGKNINSVKQYRQFHSEKIFNQDLYLTLDPKSGRIYNNFTNLPKELRKYITDADGNYFAEADLSNCQLLLLDRLMYNNHKWVDTTFRESVHGGYFYENILDKYYMPNNKYSVINRADVRKKLKVDILTYLFIDQYKIENAKNMLIKNVFETEFPSVNKFVRNFKIKKGNIELAVTLQKMEADYMIHTILPILLNKKYNFLTIHDSVMIPVQELEKVKKIMYKEFNNMYRITPHIKSKELI